MSTEISKNGAYRCTTWRADVTKGSEEEVDGREGPRLLRRSLRKPRQNFGAKIEQRRQKVSTDHPINEATLSRLADSVPDKYRYNEQLGGSYKNIGANI